jgi:hypothetical protein
VADNVTIDPGPTPSVVIGTDDCGAGGQVQLMKLAYSANGVATAVTADANGVKVQQAVSAMTLTHAAVACNNSTSVTALAADSNRKYCLFVNDSANVIYLNFGAAAVASTGIRLNASGGSYELPDAAGHISTVAVAAISAAGTGQNLLVTSG